MSRIKKLTLIAVIITAAFFRLYGLNWDQNQHLHPDERFLTMVAGAISWPDNSLEYLDAQQSPLNPANAGFSFFVYGTFPLFFTKAIVIISALDDYTNLTLLGRALSAIFDIGTVLLVYFIAKELSLGIFPLLSAFFYSIAVLPIQLSHFFAVDTFLTFFITLSFYLLMKLANSATNCNKLTSHIAFLAILLGISFGLALASKISALLFLPIILLGIVLRYRSVKSVIICVVCVLSAVLTFRLANPYAFATNNLLNPTLNSQFVDNLKTLKSFDKPDAYYPPAVQWIKTKPFVFPLRNMVYYGLGTPLGLLAIGGVFYAIYNTANNLRRRKLNIPLLLIVLWIAGFLFYQGAQFVKALRYFAPIYPFLTILAALLATQSVKYLARLFNPSKIYLLIVIGYLLLVILWPLAFISIYSRPHSRVAASRWIYENIPPGATITCEHWDDCLPLTVSLENDSRLYSPQLYTTLGLPLYDQDAPEKWTKINETLAKADYIILSSNRLYGSIPSVPERYPQATEFYQKLFAGATFDVAQTSFKFTKIAQFTSRPRLPLPFFNICIEPPFEWYGKISLVNVRRLQGALQKPVCDKTGLTIVDDYADESFTVYDHPTVIIFRKTPLASQASQGQSLRG